jgi:predicted transcriptional regulator
MLNRVKFPLTRAQISDFMLTRNYTNFITLQQVFAELVDADMITAQTYHNRTNIYISDEGRETLHFFENRIGENIRNDMDHYFKEHEMELRNEVSITAEYYKSTSGEFEAHLQAKEKGIPLVQVTLSVPEEETASAICDHWHNKNQEIYKYLIEQLF